MENRVLAKIKRNNSKKMTPEETKANELIDKFYDVYMPREDAIHCALICIEEIINYVADTPAYREVDSLKKIKEAIQKA